jgi:hypothetical protein
MSSKRIKENARMVLAEIKGLQKEEHIILICSPSYLERSTFKIENPA